MQQIHREAEKSKFMEDQLLSTNQTSCVESARTKATETSNIGLLNYSSRVGS